MSLPTEDEGEQGATGCGKKLMGGTRRKGQVDNKYFQLLTKTP